MSTGEGICTCCTYCGESSSALSTPPLPAHSDFKNHPSFIQQTPLEHLWSCFLMSLPQEASQPQALTTPLLSSHTDLYRPTHCLSPLEKIPVQVCLPCQSRLLSMPLGRVTKLEVKNVGKKWRAPGFPSGPHVPHVPSPDPYMAARGGRPGRVPWGRGFTSAPLQDKCPEYRFYNRGLGTKSFPFPFAGGTPL